MSGLDPVHGTALELLALLRDWDSSPHAEPLVVETSGSTAAPKRVLLSRVAMRASADATHRRLGGPGQWLLTLPPTYVAGLQVLFRSVRARTEPVVATSLGEGLAAMTGERRYVSVVPTQLHRALDHGPETQALEGFDTMLVGGAPLDLGLRAEAEAVGATIVTTYGMSETCGGCVYDGRPLDGVRVRTGADGRLQIRGRVLFDGYQAQPDLTAAVLQDGWFVTSDLGRVTEQGLVEVLGRADDVIITGGLNVRASVVAGRIRTHQRISAVEVVGVPDEEWGEAVVALVVGDVALAEVRDHVAEALPRSFGPRRVIRVESIPLLPNGKVDRLALDRLARG